MDLRNRFWYSGKLVYFLRSANDQDNDQIEYHVNLWHISFCIFRWERKAILNIKRLNFFICIGPLDLVWMTYLLEWDYMLDIKPYAHIFSSFCGCLVVVLQTDLQLGYFWFLWLEKAKNLLFIVITCLLSNPCFSFPVCCHSKWIQEQTFLFSSETANSLLLQLR